jgi:hypothetical protein
MKLPSRVLNVETSGNLPAMEIRNKGPRSAASEVREEERFELLKKIFDRECDVSSPHAILRPCQPWESRERAACVLVCYISRAPEVIHEVKRDLSNHSPERRLCLCSFGQ